MSAGMRRAAVLLVVGRTLHRAADALDRVVPGAQLKLARGLMVTAEMIAPSSMAGTSRSTIDGSEQSHFLVVGRHELENASCVIHAADRVTENYAGYRVTVPVAFDEED
jgi:hypothetical protein